MLFFKRKKINRKWQERPRLYRGRFFYVRQITQVSLALAAIGLVISLVLYFKNSETLSINHVEVLGDIKHLNKDDVIKLSEIEKSDKLFALNMKKVQKNIKRFSWIKDVSVRREFPDTIQIYVTERKPVALLVARDMFLVDENGDVFKSVESGDPLDLPVISGFDHDELTRYTALTGQSLRSTLAFLKFIEKQDFYKEHMISEIHFDRVFGITVFTKDSGLEIYYGKTAFREKQKKLEKFKLSKHFQTQAFVRLDLDSLDRVIARRL